MGSKILLTLRHSRKSFLIEYSCAVLVLALLAVAYFKGVNMPSWASYSMYAVAFTAVGSAELGRLFGDRYKITEEKLMIVQGVIKIRNQNVYYQPLGFIPDIHLKQSALQRILGYGTVYVVISGNKFEIKNVDEPYSVLEMIEDLIGRNKHEILKPKEERK